MWNESSEVLFRKKKHYLRRGDKVNENKVPSYREALWISESIKKTLFSTISNLQTHYLFIKLDF